MSTAPQTWLHVALGAAGASALIIASTHLLWPVPLWAVAPRPTAPDADEAKYLGLLLGAVVAAGVGFNAWLAAFYQLRRAGAGRGAVRSLLLPVLLLLPFLVHFLGYRRHTAQVIEQNQAVIDRYRAQH